MAGEWESMGQLVVHTSVLTETLYIAVVDQLATRGYQPHFDELLLRLNFSGFYKSSQQQLQC